MWYVSGNRDDEVIERPDEFIIDRKIPAIISPSVSEFIAVWVIDSLRCSFECCGGNLRRFSMVEVVGEPERVQQALFEATRHCQSFCIQCRGYRAEFTRRAPQRSALLVHAERAVHRFNNGCT